LVDHGNELICLGDRSIALPVSSDEKLAGLDLGRGMVGAILKVVTKNDTNSVRFNIPNAMIELR
jgi:hypothetical protein